MSNSLQFLVAMGSNAHMAQLNPAQYAAAVAALELDDDSRAALLDRDGDRLGVLLGGRQIMSCLIAPAEDEPAREGGEEEPEPGDDSDRNA